ncbi:uncharacterized protein LOC127846089 [Dreissena polymorpha]|uniref:uncharacterized protein LOC127846089 n=1 Tax=Dreissena polymorpha TaxID=45954 RepID=UPI0022644305|nr:uncharacterized protein LOC127846089 [Dreissena polymorpha]
MAVLEKDTKTLWLALEDRVKRVDERVSKLEHSTEGADIAVAHVSSRIDDLERERNSLREDLTNSKETMASIKFERVHRSPGEQTRGKARSIIIKFAFLKDKESVRREWKQLTGTNYNVWEQFPPEVVAKRRQLLPKMKEARSNGKRSWISYDTLYVDGRPVRD